MPFSRRAKTPPRRPKRPPKRPKTGQDCFFEPTWAHVGANMEPCWHRNRTPKVSYVKTAWKLKMPIFQYSLNDFSIFGDVFFELKSIYNRMQNAIRAQRAHFFLLFRWKSDLGLSWKHLRGILGRLGRIFGVVLAPKTPSLGPKTPPRWAQDGPRRLQDGARRIQDGPRWLKTAQDVPKRLPRWPKTPPRWPKSPILQDFGTPNGATLPKLKGPAVIAAGVGNNYQFKQKNALLKQTKKNSWGKKNLENFLQNGAEQKSLTWFV